MDRDTSANGIANIQRQQSIQAEESAERRIVTKAPAVIWSTARCQRRRRAPGDGPRRRCQQTQRLEQTPIARLKRVVMALCRLRSRAVAS
jgi:hypothetical protein